MPTCTDTDGDNTVGNDTVSPLYCVHWAWTQDFHLKVRGEVESQCTGTQNLYLRIRGEVGTLWSRHTGPLSKGQRRGGVTVYRHIGLPSKDQRRGGVTVYRHIGLPSKDQRRGGVTVYRHSGPLSKGQRRGGPQWSRHTEVTPPLWSTCLQWTKRLRLGMMSKELTVWSDWQLNPCRLKTTNDCKGK